MTFDEVFQALEQKFPGVVQKLETKPDPAIKVDPTQIHDVVRFLKESLQFQTITCITGVDYPKIPALCVVYHFHSYTHKLIVGLKCYLPREGEPSIRSLVDLYKGADWLERETFDMVGVRFEGHLDLRRILCPEDWVGFPLRKDYQTPDFYNGMPIPLYFEDKADGTVKGDA